MESSLDYPGGLNISQGLGDKKKERVRLFNVRRTQPDTVALKMEKSCKWGKPVDTEKGTNSV